jgi:hypothetical protein
MTDVRAHTRSGARNGLRSLFCGMGVILAALFISSCGNSTFVAGTPVITLSAKPGRFTSYIVTLAQIYMTRQDGTLFYVPSTTSGTAERVDLANLSNYTNLLEAPAAATGTYVSATFVLDYSSAYVTVGVDGGVFPVTLVDPATSAAPTTITVTVKFDPNHPLVINSQNSSPVAFDIDLEASNIITSTATGLQVRVKPFWNVTTQPVYDEPLYARGLFVFADTNNSNFTMNLRPLHDTLSATTFGALTVNVTNQTYYNVNGVTYVGAAGLAAMAALKNAYANLQVAVYGAGSSLGNLSTITPSFNATSVYVGTSLESAIEDQVTGIVSGISGNTLTVLGAAYVDRAVGSVYAGRIGDLGFRETTPVTVGPNTIVSIDGVAGVTPTLKSISVGQVITVLGQASLDSTGNALHGATALDATGNSVPGAQLRLQNTTLFGTVNSATSGSVSLNLLSLDRYPPTFFNFAGTGVNSGLDATAASYVINTSAVNASAPATGLVKIDGLANGFGSAPPDFNATALTPGSSLPEELILEWTGGGAAGSPQPFSTVNQGGIIVNLDDAALTGAGATHLVRTGPTTVDLANQPNPHTLLITLPPAGASGVLLGVGSVSVGETVFTDPLAFANQVLVVDNSAGSEPILKLVATGQYDASTGTFAATNVTINSK